MSLSRKKVKKSEKKYLTGGEIRIYDIYIMHARKIFRLDRSPVITIPEDMLREYELEVGDYILELGVKEGILLKKLEWTEHGIKVSAIRRDPGAKNRP